MFLVYKLIFVNRLKNKNYPYYYIGSKSNCVVKDNIIYDKYGKQYWGSSRSKLFKNSFLEEIPNVEILSYGIDSKDILEKEISILKENNADKNVEFFNMFIPPITNFTFSEYATYKHFNIENKIARLKRDDELVKNGTFVGITKNCKLSIERKEKISKYLRENNPFRGKHHTEETKKYISKINSVSYDEKFGIIEAEKIRKHLKSIRKKGITLKDKEGKFIRTTIDDSRYISGELVSGNVGKICSEETKRKISKKGFFMIKSIKTLESKRILKEDFKNFDQNEWFHFRRANTILKENK